ncbi:MAG: ABC transporter ATP-binding protein [Rhodanobacteraceae bacterium]
MDRHPQPIVLALERVTCRLAGRKIVHALDIQVARGEVLGLLGVNGAGKSTTLRMMAGLLRPTSGRVRLDGVDLAEEPEHARRHIGYLPEEPPLHGELDVEEYLVFCARLHGLTGKSAAIATAHAIGRCELGDVRRRLVGVLSRGFRQRVGLAQAIIHEPAVIVLDEPASGLDPVQALKLRDLIAELRDHAVVLSTHVLSDVQACCDRVAILHDGRLRHTGMLRPEAPGSLFRVGIAPASTNPDWHALTMVRMATPLVDDGEWRVELAKDGRVEALAAALVERGFGLTELRAEDSTIEETFLRIAAADVPLEAA